MELSDYLRIVRQRGWLIILLGLLTAAGAFQYSRMQTPIYESTMRLLITPSRTDFGQAQAAKVLLRSYTTWMNSRYRAQDVIDTLQLDTKPGDLLASIAIAADDSSFVITMEVENANPDLANDIARTWGNLLIQRQNGLNATLRKEDRIEIELVDDPQYSLKSPSTQLNTVAGGVFGAILGILIIVMLEWLESGIVRRTDDIERHLELPVVGTIPK